MDFSCFLALLFGWTCSFSQTEEQQMPQYLYFQKIKNKQRTVRYKLPLQCRIYLDSTDKRFGKIVAVSDTLVSFEFKNYDTAAFNKIIASEFKKKEKDRLVDSLVDSSKTIQLISLDQLREVAILSGDANVGREVGMLLGSLGFMGSGALLMARRSNQVGQNFQKTDWIALGGLGMSAALMGILTKRSFDLKKWQIVEGFSKPKSIGRKID